MMISSSRRTNVPTIYSGKKFLKSRCLISQLNWQEGACNIYIQSTNNNMAAILPNLEHFDLNDAQNVYEPSDDTFLLCDSLNKDREYLVSLMQQSIATQRTRIPAIVEVVLS